MDVEVYSAERWLCSKIVLNIFDTEIMDQGIDLHFAPDFPLFHPIVLITLPRRSLATHPAPLSLS
jgi:hypothetical protein